MSPVQENRSGPTIVYLLAASHSGSTLSAMLLNSHPDICTAGELKLTHLGDADSYRCSCRAKISECEFWNSVAARMNERGHDFDVRNARTDFGGSSSAFVQRLLRPLHRGSTLEAVRDAMLKLSPSWRNEWPDLSARNQALYESVSAVSGQPYVVDSSKSSIRLKFLLRSAALRVKVVRIVRDGRAVALTYMDPDHFADASDPSLRGGGTGRSYSRNLGMEVAAREWRRSNEAAEAVLGTVHPNDFIQISYEEMCGNTVSVLNRIYEFLGVATREEFDNFREAEHHVVGNGMRLDDTSKVVLDERWRDILTKSQLADFDRIAGDLNRQYGYK